MVVIRRTYLPYQHLNVEARGPGQPQIRSKFNDQQLVSSMPKTRGCDRYRNRVALGSWHPIRLATAFRWKVWCSQAR